jgi:hypothetical protein
VEPRALGCVSLWLSASTPPNAPPGGERALPWRRRDKPRPGNHSPAPGGRRLQMAPAAAPMRQSADYNRQLDGFGCRRGPALQIVCTREHQGSRPRFSLTGGYDVCLRLR